MKKFKKALGIILAISMLLTLMPAGVVLADDISSEAYNEFTFSKFKGENKSQFDITTDLELINELSTTNGYNYTINWTSSDESVISPITGEVVNPNSKLDTWVNLTASFTGDGEDFNKTFKLRIKGLVNSEDVLFEENFANLPSGSFTNTDSTSETHRKWYITGDPASASTTFEIINTNKDADGNLLHMIAKSSGNNDFFTNENFTLPSGGLIEYSADVMFPYHSMQVPFFPLWQVKGTSTISYPFNNGQKSANYNFKNGEWHHVTTVYDKTNRTVDTYIDGEWLYGDTGLSSSNIIPYLGKIQTRMQANASYSGSEAYIDNIRVRVLNYDTEAAAMTEFNPVNAQSDYANSMYVDMDLAKNITIGNDIYDVTYESDDVSVIAEDGKVSLSDFVRVVGVTPKINIGGTVISGKKLFLTVMPVSTNYSLRLFENFENKELGQLFNDNGSPKYVNSWTQNRGITESGYETNTGSYYYRYNINGVKADIEKEGENKVLHMQTVASKGDYRLNHAVADPEKGDRIALSFKVKNISSNMGINLMGQYIGRLRGNTPGVWRGDMGSTEYEDVNSSAMTIKNQWLNFLFIYDRGIVVKKNDVDVHPISLYVNGEYIGTSYSTKDAAWLSHTTLEFYQNSNYGDGNMMVDDILLMNFDSEAVQLAGTEVEDRNIASADVQYISYEQDMTADMKLLVAAYNSADELVGAKVVDASPRAVGMNEVPVDYDLPTEASYYRLFLFDGLSNIKPLALSRNYNIAE